MAERLKVMRGVIHPWHLDHFGHMNVRHYAPFFDDAVYHLWALLGQSYDQMLAQYGIHAVTAQASTGFRRELVAGDLVLIDAAVARLGNKSCTFRLQMRHAVTDMVHATYDVVEVFFDPKTRQSTAMPDALRALLQPHLVQE
jgi:acyl-CoA thioester hydrolase